MCIRDSLVLRMQNLQHVALVITDRLLDLRSVVPFLQEAFPLFGQRWDAVQFQNTWHKSHITL
eukprot:12488914-Alexandrium_andersonii.AAC.1